MTSSPTLNHWLLRAGLWLSVLYFGVQPVAALFYPGYDALRQPTSDLGAPQSPAAWLLNSVAVLSGLAGLAAAVGIWRSRATPRLVVALCALAIASLGLGNIWAGVFPLPDPRHGANPFTPAYFLTPLLCAALLWRNPRARVYAGLNVVALLGLIALRVAGVNLSTLEGAFQRAIALVVFVPVAVLCLMLERQRTAQRA